MNAEPHVHEVRVRDHARLFLDVDYGDQSVSRWYHDPGMTRFPFESEQHYAKRHARIIQRMIAKVVRKHDRASQLAPLFVPTVPTFRPDEWGSEQLPK